ncbi:MAG: hypothetical protein J0M12_05840 [Deltaproteobacteria bacterium]|nr:hypothetical protein [Deltaproteobacteria bacterium]
MNTESAPQPTPTASRLRKFLPHIVAVLALLSLLVVSTLLWLEIKRRFPVLEPGGYYGTLRGVLDESEGPLHFYVERQPQGDDLFFCVLNEGWKPQVVSAVIRSGGSDSGWLLPVTVVGEKAKLKFIGTRIGPGEYQGTVSDMSSSAEGSWTLHAVQDSPAAISASDEEELRLWLRKRAELTEVERKIKEFEARVPQQKADIEKVTEFISERGQVQASSDAQLKSAKDEQSQVRKDLDAAQDRLRRLQERIEISQRISPSGKLAALGRESLERDARWAESLLRTSGAETVTGLDDAVVRGQKILEMKREIELEKNTIFKLTYDGAAPARAEEVGHE